MTSTEIFNLLVDCIFRLRVYVFNFRSIQIKAVLNKA